ncbi:UDP-glucose/GDP-mannose dehydrogenase family protein [Falsiroseomonas bella]|uniref:UDP-glucose 6-dehydrogenase n=1 Tax=Falsiroseomonas bella TaxID=2184016 RepID=A0A317FHV1_9PROT|nr:nucleotide sugar dehydrogenase [Falsiroseomonas bella]PWS38365.1 UDP-glucose/GDP-mannose dehydrogenase family protein [Falsiroseomonas bella]
MDRKTQPPRLSVIGLGKLGSPMAAVFGAKGFDVVGIDLNPAFVQAINEGRAPVQEPGLQEQLDRARGRVRATQDWNDLVTSTDISFIIVPTPSGPDRMFVNRFVVDAVERIGAALRGKPDYHVVVVTSTVMPGSTDGEIRAALERSSGRTVGQDVGLCYNPEFIALGSVVRDMLFPDMILIGESDARAGEMLEQVYRGSVDSKPEFHRMNLVNAELCKISVNTFVTTKISYANMIAELCDHLPGADADVVTRAVGADSRIGRKYLKPAIGYGGPCFPRDNKAFAALGRRLGVNTALAEATDAINEHQFQRMIGAVAACAEPGQAVAVLGLSYKPDTAVVEESQGVALALQLAEAGYQVRVFDPLAMSAAAAILGDRVTRSETAADALRGVAAAVLTTPWAAFKEIAWAECGAAAVIDPWSLVPRDAAGTVRVVRLGQGDWRRGAPSLNAAAA